MTEGSSPDRDPQPTEALARRARESGGEGFADLYARLAPSLRAWAALRIPQPLRAMLAPDDLVQEVCFRAYGAFDRFDPARGSFRGWLFGIAHKVLQESLVRRARAPRNADAGAEDSKRLVDTVPEDVTSISRRAARNELVDVLLAKAEALDPDDQRLLLARGFEDRPHDEIAAELGIGLDACKKRWQRLRDTLRERFDADWIEE